MSYPSNLKYTKNHEWVLIDGDSATVGITHFAQSELGDIVYLDIETVGDKMEIDQVFGTVEAVKTVSDLYSPLSGTVTEFNEALNQQPELVNKDCYGEGWLIKMTIENGDELKDLLSSDQYQEILG